MASERHDSKRGNGGRVSLFGQGNTKISNPGLAEPRRLRQTSLSNTTPYAE